MDRTLRVGGSPTSHVRIAPLWSAWSPAVSGSVPIDGGSLGTRRTGGIPLATWRRGCVAPGSAFPSASKPGLQDLLHLDVRGESVDLWIVDPGLQVYGSHVVCIALPVALPVGIATVKPVPAAVVSRDVTTGWVGTGLAGVGRVDYSHIGTSDVRMHRHAFFILGTCPR